MSDDKKKGFDWGFSNKAVFERMESGRRQMEGVHEDVDKKKTEDVDEERRSEEQASIGTIKKKKGNPYGSDKPISGKLDTQLFPNRKPPYHE